MDKFERALQTYLLTKCNVPSVSPNGTDYVYTDLGVEHEEGWSNDSGTSWPASVEITYRRDGYREGKKVGTTKGSAYVGSDPIEFMRELFELEV